MIALTSPLIYNTLLSYFSGLYIDQFIVENNC